MTAREVMNPSPTVDAAIDPPHPVRDQNLQMVVEQARDQLRELMQQRQKIDQRIAIIKRTINGLVLLYGGEFQRRPEEVATGNRRRGITTTCRLVLDRADTPLTARGVYAVLQEKFPDLFRKPGDCYASLVAILGRLAKSGEADTFLRNRSRFWKRHQSVDHRSVGPSCTSDRWYRYQQPGTVGDIGQDLITKARSVRRGGDSRKE